MMLDACKCNTLNEAVVSVRACNRNKQSRFLGFAGIKVYIRHDYSREKSTKQSKQIQDSCNVKCLGIRGLYDQQKFYIQLPRTAWITPPRSYSHVRRRKKA